MGQGADECAKVVSVEASEVGSIGVGCMWLLKVVTILGSGDDRLLLVGLYICVSHCDCRSDCICC